MEDHEKGNHIPQDGDKEGGKEGNRQNSEAVLGVPIEEEKKEGE